VGETMYLSKLNPNVFDRNRNGIAVKAMLIELFLILDESVTRRLNIPR
jgi:hypothetical protein